jgi:hypothetical protein
MSPTGAKSYLSPEMMGQLSQLMQKGEFTFSEAESAVMTLNKVLGREDCPL